MPVTLHHVALSSPRAADAVGFYTQDWGLHEVSAEGTPSGSGPSGSGGVPRGGTAPGGSVRLGAASDRGDDYSLVLLTSEQKAVDHFCLVSDDEATIDQLEQRVRAGGVRVLEDVPACPGLVKAFHIADIDGRRVEIGYRPSSTAPAGATEAAPTAATPDAVPVKPAHIVLNTPDAQAATDWYQEKLGFGLRDWREQKMSFLYYSSDHHTVAFNAAPHVSLNHVAWEIADINQFFRGVGRASATTSGEKLYGPGRHGPGEYVFCYFLDPMGFMCEYETDAIRIEDPADYQFRVWKYSPESADQWLGTLSGGPTQRWRKASLGEPDPGLVVSH